MELLQLNDYAYIGQICAKKIFANLNEAERKALRKQPQFERECSCQDLAINEAERLRKITPALFGVHQLGYRATREYGWFEEIFMKTLSHLLVEDYQTILQEQRHKTYKARLERNRESRTRLGIAS